MPKHGGKAYSEIFLHLVWRTKDNYPAITPAIRPHLYEFIARRIAQGGAATLHAIGGTADHVHLCV